MLRGARGESYNGDFVDGRFHGAGTYTAQDGSKFSGTFVDGSLNGRGSAQYSNGDRYIGEFQDDQRHGMGLMIFSNGDRYEGGFEFGNFHGEGRFTDGATGEVLSGQWKDGEYVSEPGEEPENGSEAMTPRAA